MVAVAVPPPEPTEKLFVDSAVRPARATGYRPDAIQHGVGANRCGCGPAVAGTIVFTLSTRRADALKVASTGVSRRWRSVCVTQFRPERVP